MQKKSQSEHVLFYIRNKLLEEPTINKNFTIKIYQNPSEEIKQALDN